MSGTGAAIVTVLFLAPLVVAMVWLGRSAFSATPQWIYRKVRLQGVYRTRVTRMFGAWDPSKPDVRFARTFEPGEAKYWLDDPETVHLEVRRSDGHIENLRGPVPKVLIKATPDARRSRRVTRAVIGLYVLLLIVGVVVGAVVASGSPGHRIVGAVIGIFVALAVAWFVMLVLNVALSGRQLIKEKNVGHRPGNPN